jgi:hypothetical protein
MEVEECVADTEMLPVELNEPRIPGSSPDGVAPAGGDISNPEEGKEKAVSIHPFIRTGILEKQGTQQRPPDPSR